MLIRPCNAIALLLIAANCCAADAAPGALLGKLRSQAGTSAKDCGAVALGSDRAAAIACVKDAVAAGTAFRVAMQLQSADSSVWQGAARDARGRVWVMFYDSGPAGAGSTFSEMLCRQIRIEVHGGDGDAIECQPTSIE